MPLAKKLTPPYWAVIFSSERTPGDRGYGTMADRMMALAAQQPGFLGVETARDPDGTGITVSYWKDEASIKAWREVAEHREAQKLGRETWYASFRLRVAKVERESAFER